MSGLGPVLYAPYGASFSFRLNFLQAADNAPIDLSAASAVTFSLRSSPTLADADAELTLSVGSGLTIIDGAAGLVEVIVTSAQHLALRPYGPYYYQAQADFASGARLIPDLLRGLFYNDLDSVEEQECDGVTVTRLDGSTGTLTPVTPDMSNFILNRYDLTALTGGALTALDGLTATSLSLLGNGARLVIGLTAADTEKIRAEYVLGLKGSDVESAPWIIVCDNAPTRCWRLDEGTINKGGQPVAYNSTSGKFHRIWALGANGSATPAVDETGFDFPA